MCIRKTLQSKEKCIKLTQDLTVHKLIIYILYVLSIVLFFEWNSWFLTTQNVFFIYLSFFKKLKSILANHNLLKYYWHKIV